MNLKERLLTTVAAARLAYDAAKARRGLEKLSGPIATGVKKDLHPLFGRPAVKLTETLSPKAIQYLKDNQ